MRTKSELRAEYRARRKAHVESLPELTRGLLFRRPPTPLVDAIAPDAIIGLYWATPDEAPTAHYIGWFAEQGHRIALPHFATPASPITFAEHTDPACGSDLTMGSFGIMQPADTAPKLTPDVLIVPLLAYTARGERLGQGGGHYDRWFAKHPRAVAIGLAWDCQETDSMPTEPHDLRLAAVVTPTRIIGALV